MTGINNRLVIGAAILSAGLVLASPATLLAQTMDVLAKTEVAAMGHLVVKAAHFTGQNPRLVRYEVIVPKSNRATYTLTMEYYGKFSGKRYVATIDIHMYIDEAAEAMRVDYSDNNPYFSANASKLARVVHQINNLLGTP